MKWFFNIPMICGFGLAFLFLLGFSMLFDAMNHRGSGVVSYGRDGEKSMRVSEAEYKRDGYADGGLIILSGLCVWGAVAYVFRRED